MSNGTDVQNSLDIVMKKFADVPIPEDVPVPEPEVSEDEPTLVSASGIRLKKALEKLQEECGDTFPRYIFGIMSEIAIHRGFLSDVEDVVFFKRKQNLSPIQVVEFMQRRIKKLQKDLEIK